MDIRYPCTGPGRPHYRCNFNLHSCCGARHRVGMVQDRARTGMGELKDTSEYHIFCVPDAIGLVIETFYKRSPLFEKKCAFNLVCHTRSFVHRKRFREHLVSEEWNQQRLLRQRRQRRQQPNRPQVLRFGLMTMTFRPAPLLPRIP